MSLRFVAKLQHAPATMPIMTEAQKGMNPEAGVAATKPAMVPEQKPTVEYFFSNLQSSRHQTIPPKAAASIEFQMAVIARRLAPKALPPLKPLIEISLKHGSDRDGTTDLTTRTREGTFQGRRRKRCADGS